ncbi:phosphatidylglycerophosphate synthase [Jannaschia pagri]|uniref:Phosphatidylglycerophosphate synthase n=1 Tax=Jannaschia pagri TaxID=2829797 RepID=A0ABQ4NND0_9RHOB|nr:MULTISPECIES: CDP-alcohol phosphatidyltransferase family protein [unclassified Jannaschia]GIT91926.1 phosphatidylglycerophosphate synthase [Jannaschia sp. AI_61]GIT95760.1 phosphatidylglycerophosphate synthase [Jannaschia sp. AI_62]
MLDTAARRLIDPPLNRLGQGLAGWGVSANTVTFLGLALGIVAGATIALGAPGWALIPLLASRLADGLDGAVARATRKTDLGGYFDIWADFLFYGLIPLAFALLDPSNGTAAAFLLFAFYVNGTSFLGVAILAAKRGLETTAQGQKSLYYSAGLLEGTETILFFVLLCLMPQWFVPLSLAFGALCLFTAAARVLNARHLFTD